MLEPEKQLFLIDHLAESARAFAQSVSTVDPIHWAKRPAPDRWSVSEIAEHVLIIDTRVAHLTSTLDEWPEENYDLENSARKDQLILSIAEDRSTRIEAPEQVRPSGALTSTEFSERFPSVQGQLTNVIKSNAGLLRGRFKAHPFLKKLDGYQWLLVCSCHRRRHLHQAEEAKSAVTG